MSIEHENIEFSGGGELGYLSYDQIYEHVAENADSAASANDRFFKGDATDRKLELVSIKIYQGLLPGLMRSGFDEGALPQYGNRFLDYQYDGWDYVATREVGVRDEELGDMINLAYINSVYGNSRRKHFYHEDKKHPKLKPQLAKVLNSYMGERFPFVVGGPAPKYR